jgi:hypothetical protein
MSKGTFVFDDIHSHCAVPTKGGPYKVLNLYIRFDIVNPDDQRGAIIIEPESVKQRELFLTAGLRCIDDISGYVAFTAGQSPQIFWRPDEDTQFNRVIREAMMAGWTAQTLDDLQNDYLGEILSWPMRVIRDKFGIRHQPAFSRSDNTPILFERYWSMAS